MNAELPKGWKRAALGQCCDIISGATPSRNVPEYWDGNIPWVTPKDISKLDQPILEDAPEKITQAGYAACSTTLMPAGSVLFSSRAPIGLVAIAGRKICTNQGFKSLVPGKDVDGGFLYWTMKRNAPRVAALGNGATFKEVSKEIVARFEIDLPPLDEQRRIAAILDKADAIRRKRQQALALADDFLRSAFLELFGPPVANPHGWACAPIETCVSSVDAGWSAKGLDCPAGPDEVGVLKISAVTSGRYRPSENKAVEDVEVGRPLVTPQKGDLLFSRANTRELVAATCIVNNTVENVFLPDKLWRIRLKPLRATPEYLKFVLSDPTFRAALCSKATGTSGSMLNISQGKLLETMMPLPPIDRQRSFSSLFWRVEATRTQLVEQAEDDTAIFASLSQRAFRGEL